MVQRTTSSSYGQALFWVAALVALFCCVTMIPRFFMIHFIQHHPPETPAFAIRMIFLITPIISAAAAATALLTFVIPQYAQRLLENARLRRIGATSHIGILFALPITALLTWYCFDYIVMTILPMLLQSEDDASYEHGITPGRPRPSAAVNLAMGQ
jgi:hypothetical protein